MLERFSGLTFNKDFFAGYSLERVNPGDKEHTVTKIKKVTSGSTPEAAQKIDALYRSIITAGTHLATSIRVAEAAKVIENSQRDINIAFVNELAMIFNRMGIDTHEVLAATKWNFLPFKPGLIGSASALIPATSPRKPRSTATTLKSSSQAAASTTTWANMSPPKW